jgi:uncharacterized membrane protein (UPF0127 family)
MNSLRTMTMTITMTALIFTAASCNRNISMSTVTLAGKKVVVEIADETPEHIQGLSGRQAIEEDQGMLFLFDNKQQKSFWMKDMNFAIDIIWIDGNTIVDMDQSVQPEPGRPDVELLRYMSSVPVDKVLELNAGWAERNGLKIGDKVTLNLK